MPPAVKNATFIYEIFQSFEGNKLLPSSYLEVSKFSLKMNRYFKHYKYYATVLGTFLFCFIFATEIQQCSICLQSLKTDYSVDAWGNAFHSNHEKEGLFCHSCSRIISQGVTRGGYVYPDGRHLCSLCQITAVHEDSSILRAYRSVTAQLKAIHINKIPMTIPINLVNLNQLNEKAGNLSHLKLKGFTHFETNSNSITNSNNPYHIFILSGLPRIEFEAVLAHEFLHVWIELNSIQLNEKTAEGFCNMGSYLIYKNDGTRFSQIHLQAMENDPDEIYGSGFRNMKSILLEIGWEKLLIKIRTFLE
ncbi:MAG: protein DA1 [Candidatus Marinimicrobia bacterium]|nr:protein DA1 [Candidatus Neomarinimicrobiota bacterium]